MKLFKKSFIIITMFMLIVMMSACSKDVLSEVETSTNEESNVVLEAYPVTITDDLGNEVTIDVEPTKLVSLAPSNTEILFALGLGDKVIGRTEYCDYPKEAESVEVVGGFSNPNLELIISLEPDVVFAQGSVKEETKSMLEGLGIKVVIFNPSDIDGVISNIEKVAKISNVEDNAKKLTASMQAKREEILLKIKDEESKKVFVDIGGFVSTGKGSFLDSMLNELKAVNIAADVEGQWPTLTLETIVDADPEVYISLYTPIEELKAVSGLEGVSAFVNDHLHTYAWGTDENSIVQRPGPRVVDGLELYAKVIYPGVFE
ncbi:MAG: ABC transporter substrate-binding protein [Acidaminobacteraceae bacterium]